MTEILAARIGVLEALTEKGVVDAETIERIISYFETEVGPMVARASLRARVDPAFRERLHADATKAIAELGIGGLESGHMVVVENTPEVHHVVVCTLCSCYPWAVLGLPPTCYKSPEYRSRMSASRGGYSPNWASRCGRRSRSRSGTRPPSSATWLCPERPPGTDALDEESLAQLVTRDAMIGVGVASAPDAPREDTR